MHGPSASKIKSDPRLLNDLQEQFMAAAKKLIEAHSNHGTREPLCYAPMRRLLSNEEWRLKEKGLPVTQSGSCAGTPKSFRHLPANTETREPRLIL